MSNLITVDPEVAALNDEIIANRRYNNLFQIIFINYLFIHFILVGFMQIKNFHSYNLKQLLKLLNFYDHMVSQKFLMELVELV